MDATVTARQGARGHGRRTGWKVPIVHLFTAPDGHVWSTVEFQNHMQKVWEMFSYGVQVLKNSAALRHVASQVQ